METSQQVSGGLEESTGSERAVDARSPCVTPDTCQRMNSDLPFEAGRIWMQQKYKAEVGGFGHA